LSNFVVNPYSFVAGGIDDTGLKAYYHFSEEEDDIINESESAVDLGSGADIQITNGTYNQDDGSPFGYSMYFNSSNSAYGTFGTSKSQWSYQFSQTAEWSRVFWLRLRSTSAEQWFMGDTESKAGEYQYIPNNEFHSQILNDTPATVSSNTTTGTFIPDTTSWNMYSFTYDQSLSSDNLKVQINASDEQTYSKRDPPVTPYDGDSTNVRAIASKSASPGSYGNFNIAELSEWSVIIDQDTIDALFNGGSGATIY